MAFFTKATYCIITGASIGLGKEIALQLARHWNVAGYVESTMVLVARNAAKLRETKNEVTKMFSNCQVEVVPADLSDLNTLSDVCTRVLSGYNSDQYQQAAIFHNAASIGDIINPTHQQTDPLEVTKYLTLNYTSMWTLTTRFLSHVSYKQPRFILNMSSVTQPCAGFALYGSIKSARHVFCQSLSLEYPEVRILNYDPGSCITDMIHTVTMDMAIEETCGRPERFKVFTASESINKLMDIIIEDDFNNAETTCFYD